MLRVKIFACAAACLIVVPSASAQGNRADSNGVPGSVSNLEAVVEVLRDSLGDLAGEVSALKERVIALENAGGGAEGRIMWSGGCPTAVSSLSPVVYCTSGVDFDTAAGYVSTDGTGRFTIATPGLYRINFRGRMFGAQGTAWISVLPGAGGFHTASTATDRGTTQTRDVNLDVTWPFQAGDAFDVIVESGNQPVFPWAGQTPLGAGSRVQVEYVGPLPQ